MNIVMVHANTVNLLLFNVLLLMDKSREQRLITKEHTMHTNLILQFSTPVL